MIEESLFRVKIVPDAFVKRRLVSGPIWIEAGAESFPGTGWTDFPVVILGFWLTNIQPVVERRVKSGRLPFMDGPCSAMVEASSSDVWTLMFLEGGPQRENTLFTTRIDPSTLLKQIIGAAETVFDVCKKNEWVDDDLLTLETNLQQMKRLYVMNSD